MASSNVDIDALEPRVRVAFAQHARLSGDVSSMDACADLCHAGTARTPASTSCWRSKASSTQSFLTRCSIGTCVLKAHAVARGTRRAQGAVPATPGRCAATGGLSAAKRFFSARHGCSMNRQDSAASAKHTPKAVAR